jgi:hypothetical protein
VAEHGRAEAAAGDAVEGRAEQLGSPGRVGDWVCQGEALPSVPELGTASPATCFWRWRWLGRAHRLPASLSLGDAARAVELRTAGRGPRERVALPCRAC